MLNAVAAPPPMVNAVAVPVRFVPAPVKEEPVIDPLDVSDVNTPVDGVVLPIAVLLIEPPVIATELGLYTLLAVQTGAVPLDCST